MRSENNLKTLKFHQILHVVDCITRHCCPINYAGSRGDNFSKLKIKDNANLTSKVKDTLNFDIRCRIAEEDIVDNISTIHYQNNGKCVSKYCDDTDILEHTNILQSTTASNVATDSTNISRPRFRLIVNV